MFCFPPSHRWLTYLLLLILDLLICLTMCLWMAKQSRWLLITYVRGLDLCVASSFTAQIELHIL